MKKLLNNDIVNLVQSIKKYYNLKQEYSSNEKVDEILSSNKPKHVVFVVLDGLGFNLINKAPFLNKNIIEKIDTVFPPTTACATITLQTGLYPCEHGWLGWCQYFEEWDDIIELFTGYGFYNRIKYPTDEIQKHITFKPYYENIKNNKIYFPKNIGGEATSFEEMLNIIKKDITNSDNSFSYAYWPEPDHVLHQKGENHTDTNSMIKHLDDLLEKFCNDLENTTIIVTADHGHIDTKSILLCEYPNILDCLKRLPSIEGRFANFFLEENCEEKFLESIEFLKPNFDIYKKEEFIKSDFFNLGVHNKIVDKFLGDYQLVAKGEYILEYNKVTFTSSHAGGTTQEMEVPLVIITR